MVAGQQTLTSKISRAIGGVRQSLMLCRALMRAKLLRRLGGAYLNIWFKENMPLKRDALPFCMFVHLCVIHWHFYNIVRLPRKNGFGAVTSQASVENTLGSLAVAER